jgi:hypothetical protein
MRDQALERALRAEAELAEQRKVSGDREASLRASCAELTAKLAASAALQTIPVVTRRCGGRLISGWHVERTLLSPKAYLQRHIHTRIERG